MDPWLTILAAMSGDALISAIKWLVIMALIFWLIIWFIDWAKVPEPFNRVIKVLVGLAALLMLIEFLLSLLGKGFVKWD